jgi:F-box domain
MFSPNKRQKLSNIKENQSYSLSAESGFHEINFSSTTDFSIPSVSVVKRKSPATRRASLHQFSSNINNSTEATQYSSGYSSLLSTTGSSSSTSLARTSLNRTPKKRKSEVSESDENFYNSVNFVSPLKIRKIETKNDRQKNCAKSILKEKCTSENVILSSTPIRANSRTKKWGKFSSFHPEKFNLGKSIDEDFKLAAAKPLAEHSLNISSFNISNASFNFSQAALHDIPEHVQDLCEGEIKEEKTTLLLPVPEFKTIKSDATRPFYNGKAKFNILGELYAKQDLALAKILSYLDPPSILGLSHVSKEYKNIIKSDKTSENKRQNYLKKHHAVKENKFPVSSTATSQEEIPRNERKKLKAFGSSNVNQKKFKTQESGKSSPGSRIFRNVQKVIN